MRCGCKCIPNSRKYFSVLYVSSQMSLLAAATGDREGAGRRRRCGHRPDAAADSISACRPLSLEPQGWSSQATGALESCVHQREGQPVSSPALWAEVRLAEALDKAGAACPPTVDADGEPLPSELQVAVCCQVGGVMRTVDLPWIQQLRSKTCKGTCNNGSTATACCQQPP